MNFKFSETPLTRNEVIKETFNRLKDQEITDSFEDFVWTMNAVKEVVNDPYDTLNHIIPQNILNDENKLSDYFYLIACDVQQLFQK